MTIKQINELYDLATEYIEVEPQEDDEDIYAIKRGDLRKATSVALALLAATSPALEIISDELQNAMAALLTILFEEDEEFFVISRKVLLSGSVTTKENLLNILKDVVEALEEDEDE